jgi:hypothetical protein
MRPIVLLYFCLVVVVLVELFKRVQVTEQTNERATKTNYKWIRD